MTWKEFKEAVEKAGVIDEMQIEYIDTGAITPPLEISIANKDQGVIIY